MKKVLLTLLFLLSMLCTFAQREETIKLPSGQEVIINLFDDDELCILGPVDKNISGVLDFTLQTDRLVWFHNNAFKDCSNITEVKINVKEFGWIFRSAFENCSSLKKVSIQAEIGKINIGSKVTNFLTYELNAGISKRSCNRRLSALKGFYKFYKNNKEIKNDPFEFTSSLKIEKKLPQTFYKNDIDNLIIENGKRNDQLSLRDQVILEIFLYTGIRVSELTNIHIEDIDFSNRIIRVIGKGNKERLVPFSIECERNIKMYIKECRPILAAKSVQISTFLLLNSQGKKLTTRGVEYILKQICEKILVRRCLNFCKILLFYYLYIIYVCF